LFYQWATPGDTTKGGIAVRDMASAVESRLTTDPVSKVALSPDGQWLAAIRPNGASAPPNGQAEPLMVMSSTGAPKKTLAAEVASWRIVHLAWSADSRSVFIVKGGTPVEVWQVPIDGGAPRRTGISLPGGINRISAHPDGRRLALSTTGSSSETWILQNVPAMRER
jgi:WD40 repeat protein